MNNVLVIGDVMLDCYYWGRSSRISPEAPVPIFEMDEVTYVLGGAANVAANVSSMGGNYQTAILMGVVGKDREADILRELVRDIGVTDYLVAEADRPTTTKTRVVAAGQHMLRIDCESRNWLTIKSNNTLQSRLTQILKDCGAIVLSDYAKGVVGNTMAHMVVDKAAEKDIPVFVDPKGTYWGKYVDAFCVTPNLKEFKEFYLQNYDSYVKTIEEVAHVAPHVAREYGWTYMVITLGGDGMMVVSSNPKSAKIVSAKEVEVADVSGAGDTVIAAFALEAASLESPKDLDMILTAEYANSAAAVAVSKLGTVAVQAHEVD